MITLRKLTLWERFLNLWPSRRRKYESELREGIKYLVEHPEIEFEIKE
jgi:hypothetical protein